MSLHDWAARHNITPAALDDLQRELGTLDASPEPAGGLRTEAGLSNFARLDAAKRGNWLMRNNSGSLPGPTGRPVRFGLGNISKAFNEICKSSDLIGINVLTVTPDMIGQRIGQFDATEVKHPGWRYTGTPRERAQQAFGLKVVQLGGRFRFISDPGQL